MVLVIICSQFWGGRKTPEILPFSRPFDFCGYHIFARSGYVLPKIEIFQLRLVIIIRVEIYLPEAKGT